MTDSRPTVLIVEDSDTTRTLYQRIAEDRFHVIATRSYGEAEQAIRAGGMIAVALCDLCLPDRSGLDVLRLIKREHPDCVSTLITANPEVDAVRDALNEMLAFRFLDKRGSSVATMEALEACLKKHSERRAIAVFKREGVPDVVTGLMEILFTQFPETESLSTGLASMVDKLVANAKVPDLRLASRMSLVGLLKVPPQTVGRVLSGERLDDNELRLFRDYPIHTTHLLQGLPRMHKPCTIIRDAFNDDTQSKDGAILRASKDAVWLSRRVGAVSAKTILCHDAGSCPMSITSSAMRDAAAILSGAVGAENFVSLRRDYGCLLSGDILAGDISTMSGKLLLGRGSVLGKRSLQSLRALSAAGEVTGTVEVIRKITTIHMRPPSTEAA